MTALCALAGQARAPEARPPAARARPPACSSLPQRSDRGCNCVAHPAVPRDRVGSPHHAFQAPWGQGPRRPHRRACAAHAGASGSNSLYDVLGVSESATSKEIKAAYRVKAMKLHPDVNPSADARTQFMECKTAYETLSDPAQRAAYDASRRGGFGGGLGGEFGADWDAFRKYTRAASRQAQTYSFDDLMADLDREVEEWQKERQRTKGARADSVSDVLGDITDEFLSFLEEGLGPAATSQPPRQPTASTPSSDYSSSTGKGTASSWADSERSKGSGADSERSAGQQGSAGEQGGNGQDREARARAEAAAEERRRAADRAAAEAANRAKESAAKRAEEIEDELTALKKRLGL